MVINYYIHYRYVVCMYFIFTPVRDENDDDCIVIDIRIIIK